DVVVLNAGVLERGPIEEFTDEQFDRVLGVNLRGAFLCARAAWKGLARNRGRLIAMGSISGTLGTAEAAAYNASKWGLTGLVKSLAEEGREAGIFCAAVLPGSAEEVAKILRYSRETRIPVVPRGAGSGKSGGALAERGGIILSLEKMDRIVEISRADMVCVVQPGVILENLQKAVEAEGLFYPP